MLVYPWTSLKEDYQKLGLVLCFGAGVSQSCRLPSWKELLEGLASKILDKETQSALLNPSAAVQPEPSAAVDTDAMQNRCSVGSAAKGTPLTDALEQLGLSLPAVASLLQQVESRRGDGTGQDTFVPLIVEVLYAKLYDKFEGLREGEEGAREELAKWVLKDNPTLAAVAALSVAPSEDGSFTPNPRVPAIVNFNLDGLFREFCRTRYGKRDDNPLFKTIERANKTVQQGLTRYYHPHGFVPLRDGSDDARDLVVFTEQDYFDFFAQPTGIFTYTLLSLMREYPILFVGLSFRDDNLRRLLHYSFKERIEHLRRGPGYRKEKEEGMKRHYAVLQSQGPTQNRLVECSLEALGVRPLFVRSFGELPQYLGEVYGGDWNRVFGQSSIR
jgi:hypothetical protein